MVKLSTHPDTKESVAIQIIFPQAENHCEQHSILQNPPSHKMMRVLRMVSIAGSSWVKWIKIKIKKKNICF